MNSRPFKVARLTGQELAELKQKTHQSFDRIWKRKLMTRKEAYHWLSHVMGIPEPQAHMSSMQSKERLTRVIAICDGLMGPVIEDDFASPPPTIPNGRD